ncbi:LacI family DNA-binding transcriptional regulator [Actinoplanes subglobosus]|uniref:LacI family DNA-binding transcriptional regulator n=1 Tax=Actinoplanes subglobosus TaxID=1547892 RepID=A0ABV8IQF7_9ACTN
MTVTLHDVAREAGVSYATASRALNGSDRSVRAENVARVREAAARLGYTPHVSAQAIARGSSNTVALVVGAVDDPYFASIADGVAEGAAAAGLTLTAAVTDRSPDMGLHIVRTLRGRRPRVILIAGSRADDDGVYAALAEELDQYRRAGGRVALLSSNDLSFPTLAVDHYGGAFRLAQALAGLGYRRFAVLHGDDRIRMSHERRRGFIDGLRRGGIEVGPQHVIAADLNRDGGHRATTALLNGHAFDGPGNHVSPQRSSHTPPGHSNQTSPEHSSHTSSGHSSHAPTGPASAYLSDHSSAGLGGRLGSTGGLEAIFAVNDVMAIGAMTALREAGLRPGRDVAVAGFDDIDAARDVTPTLTSVRVPLRDLGRRAVELALAGEPGVIEVPVEVVLRDSTPPR